MGSPWRHTGTAGTAPAQPASPKLKNTPPAKQLTTVRAHVACTVSLSATGSSTPSRPSTSSTAPRPRRAASTSAYRSVRLQPPHLACPFRRTLAVLQIALRLQDGMQRGGHEGCPWTSGCVGCRRHWRWRRTRPGHPLQPPVAASAGLTAGCWACSRMIRRRRRAAMINSGVQQSAPLQAKLQPSDTPPVSAVREGACGVGITPIMLPSTRPAEHRHARQICHVRTHACPPHSPNFRLDACHDTHGSLALSLSEPLDASNAAPLPPSKPS